MGVLLKDIGMSSKDETEIKGMGWRPELPDFRDYTLLSSGIAKILVSLGLSKTTATSLSASADLRKWFSPIEDQGQLGSCTAQCRSGRVRVFRK